MRRILTAKARERAALKRGAGCERVDLNGIDVATGAEDTTLLRMEEAAAALAISERTAKRYWTFARARLHDALRKQLSSD